ncbi:hypothetical protein E2562_001757 [Oryza meyeriana var. granulata]|uniref:Uncharacterized protein n=1 Tax=Oryza meyeriana var. granulata TaxID=110450 RepID=A0A6G1CBS1_9ORYZ|nr:hypothetical protein E2562_001757 [Oryza meyeriana var. granulata]KAF0898096.1 hypothetical protein E2562_001757 [Oryza meyeriana var. granulata]
MDFFKIKKLGKTRKNAGGGGETVESDEDANAGNVASDEQEGKILEDDPAAAAGAGVDADAGNGGLAGEEDDDDDDFITNEVKRRLKELRKNSFMVLIPEEECAEVDEDGEEEEEGSSSREWMETDVGDGFPLCGFDSLYEKYCQRMAVFDKMITQLLKDPGSFNISKKSPRSASKLASTLRNLSFKRRDELQEDCEHLQQQQSEDDPYQTLETAYVGHVSLSWEALHCMYVHLSLILAAQPDNPTTYSCAAQAFQQFQVLLQRFVENEPFEQGSRVEIYARSRSSLSKLLQVPTFQVADGKYNAEDQVEPSIFASDLIKLLEESILTFRLFLKKDKTKNSALMSVHSHTGSSIQQVQSSLDKKEVKVKELFKKKKGWKSKTWPATMEEVQLLFALIDIKVVSRVLRMAKLSKEQFLWCEEKMSKLDLSDNKLRRDGSPILFPC